MKKLTDYKVLLWDFDGVIMDSMPIRDRGFIEVLHQYPKEQVDELVKYHQQNGGLSRYVKFRYFFEVLRNEAITDEQVKELAGEFSKIMLALLTNKDLLINDCVDFIRKASSRFKMHIVSGSDGKELNYLCKELGLAQYFISIHGSPIPKTKLVETILEDHSYDRKETILIGDSWNDYDAATSNGIEFIAYNNEALKEKNYIQSFSNIDLTV